MSSPKPFRYDKMFGEPAKSEIPAYDPISNAAAPASQAQVEQQAEPAAASVTIDSDAQASILDAEQPVEPDEQPPPPPPPPIPLFSPATKPILDTAGTHSIRLLWEAQRQTGSSGVVPADVSLPPCALAHTLQMQEVR